jgi:hypothetical protein
MNLTGQPVYQKTPKGSKNPTKAQREHMATVATMPCVICGNHPVHVHHATCGGGGRRDHMRVLPLCEECHTGSRGIHHLGRRAWAELNGGDERHYLGIVDSMLTSYNQAL